ELFAQARERNSAAKSRRREPGAHIRKWRRRGNASRYSYSKISRAVAVERDAVTTQQPVGVTRLPLPEQLEVKVPDLLNTLHPVVRSLLAIDQKLQTPGCWIVNGILGELAYIFRELEQSAS